MGFASMHTTRPNATHACVNVTSKPPPLWVVEVEVEVEPEAEVEVMWFQTQSLSLKSSMSVTSNISCSRLDFSIPTERVRRTLCARSMSHVLPLLTCWIVESRVR